MIKVFSNLSIRRTHTYCGRPITIDYDDLTKYMHNSHIFFDSVTYMNQYYHLFLPGETPMSEAQVLQLIAKMEETWLGPSYDLLHRNCCSFSNELCINLGVGPLPGWVNALAGTGAVVYDGFMGAKNMAVNTANAGIAL